MHWFSSFSAVKLTGSASITISMSVSGGYHLLQSVCLRRRVSKLVSS